MSRAATPLAVSDGQREVLETLASSQTAAYRVVQRAQVLLLAGDGVSNSEISEVAGVSRPTVLAWRGQFEKVGLIGFGEVAKGRGRKPSISDEKVAEIVELTLHSKPEGETHWSCRSMAKRVGVSSASVQRIWSARGLKPHLVKTFKLSNDRHFEEKLIDVVGLYLNPPDQAVVLCMDEKSQIQALDRTQPSLPMKKGRAGTMTHDYKRHGTTTLFAALNVLTGMVIGRCLPRHRNTEFLKFLRIIDREVPKGLQIHMICDNYGTHVCPESGVMTMEKIVSMACAVPVMEVDPLGSPSRRRAQTAAVSCRSRAGVGSDCGEGPLSAGQVCDEKANVCEPLLTHRNVER